MVFYSCLHSSFHALLVLKQACAHMCTKACLQWIHSASFRPKGSSVNPNKVHFHNSSAVEVGWSHLIIERSLFGILLLPQMIRGGVEKAIFIPAGELLPLLSSLLGVLQAGQ